MTTKPETLYILDGNALLHRAWHAIPPLTTKDGTVVNAAYGFAMVLEKLLEKEKPDFMAVAWDLPGKTFRHEKFEDYKAHREEKEQELYDQIPIIQDILKAFGIPSISSKGYEADDVIATLSDKAGQKEIKTIIVTGDLDALQLVDKDTGVLFFQKGISETRLYDEKAVMDRFGLTPKKLIDYKALRGDPSDNIPGVSGIGDKTATLLVQEHGSIEGIIKALNEGKIVEKFAKKLQGQEQTMHNSRELVELVHNVPVEFSFENAIAKKPNLDEILKLYRDLEFKTLLRKHAVDFPAPPQQAPLTKTENSKIEEETDVLGVLATEDGVIFSSSAKIENAKEIITHNAKELLHKSNIKIDDRFKDLMIASYLLRPGSRSHDLDSIAYEYLQEKSTDPASRERRGDPNVLVKLLPKLSEVMMKELDKNKISNIFHDIEMPLIPILVEMEKTGVGLDTKALQVLSKEIKKKLEDLTKKIYEVSGEIFNINSPSQLATVLFTKMKLPTKGIKKTQTSFSTAAPELEKLIDEHEIIPLISEYRELAKLQSTYVDVLPTLIASDKRIHTTFNQTITATGRLSSKDPNLQNIPIKTELGNKIRKTFVAGRGKQLVAADYSQIELRLVAVLAKDKAFIKAFQEGADIHTRTASEVWEIPEDQVTKEQRRAAKAINFGIIYGMGPKSLARSTNMSFNEAKDFIAKYFKIHSAVKDYLEKTKKLAHDQGYVETYFGRRRYFPEISSGVPMLVAQAERMAINMPVQGTAADIMKMAMISVHGWLKKSGWPAKMLLQVHDELVLEVDKNAVDQVAKGVKELMEGVADFEVPLTVDVEAGNNWGEMERI